MFKVYELGFECGSYGVSDLINLIERCNEIENELRGYDRLNLLATDDDEEVVYINTNTYIPGCCNLPGLLGLLDKLNALKFSTEELEMIGCMYSSLVDSVFEDLNDFEQWLENK